MSFWKNLTDGAAALWADTEQSWERFNTKGVMKAFMAVCAMTAAASDGISDEEKAATLKFCSLNPLMKKFKASDLKHEFDTYCAALNADFGFASLDCLSDIEAQAHVEGFSRKAAGLAVQIGHANGDDKYGSKERAVVTRICQALKLDASEFVAPETAAV